jgi:hypothetical protein
MVLFMSGLTTLGYLEGYYLIADFILFLFLLSTVDIKNTHIRE